MGGGGPYMPPKAHPVTLPPDRHTARHMRMLYFVFNMTKYENR